MVHPVFAHMPTTVFEEMSGLARELGAINLGQGFPDDPGPEAIRAKAGGLYQTITLLLVDEARRDPDRLREVIKQLREG